MWKKHIQYEKLKHIINTSNYDQQWYNLKSLHYFKFTGPLKKKCYLHYLLLVLIKAWNRWNLQACATINMEIPQGDAPIKTNIPS